jgi:hypothetical protein
MSDQPPTQPGQPVGPPPQQPGWGPPPQQQPGPPGWAASPSPPASPQQPQWVAPPPPAPPPNWDQPQPPRPPRPPRRGTWWILGVAGVGLLLAVFALAWADTNTEPEQTSGRATATTTPINQVTSPPATEPPAPAYPTPTPRDFELTVKVLEKQNFGSAGSNITYRIEAGWSKTFDPAKTYEVRGGEDGPAINTLTVTGDEYQRESEEYISTATVGQKLTARVTDVDELP